MATEQDRALEAVQVAIQMEVDGREYYWKASQNSDNQLGRRLFETLAAEEDIHRQRFEQIYEALRKQKAWPVIKLQPNREKRLVAVLTEGVVEIGLDIKTPTTEIDAIQQAMAMENKTYDFYNRQSQQAAYDAERDYYRAVAAEEKEHHRVLLDYYEYLKDPAGWFTMHEHPSLDGG